MSKKIFRTNIIKFNIFRPRSAKLPIFHRKRNRSIKIVKIANHFHNFGNFDHLLSQTFTNFFPVLPSILSKYQFHFDQLWANITSILTNFDQRLNYLGGGVTPPHPLIATSLPQWAVFVPYWAVFVPYWVVFVPHWAVFVPYWVVFVPYWVVFVPHWAVCVPENHSTINGQQSIIL